MTEGFQTALMVGAGFAVFGALLAYLLVDRTSSETHRRARARHELTPDLDL